MLNCHVGTFTADISPPLGHPLCGGWIDPVRGQDDPLEAVGIVLLGCGAPVVLCALDWCEIRNDAYLKWRQVLADAAHTTIERVHVHAVHQHNAPIADINAEKIIQNNNGSSILDLKYFDQCLFKTAEALKASLSKTKKINRVGTGYGRVNQVASNRRILDSEGKVKYTRTSAAKSKEIQDFPEGLIDPTLRTLSFWMGEKPVVAIHYYATHPMSYYGDGMVSADFCGLARRKRQSDSPSVFQMYFTGCAGNITAGKYNDGSKGNRAILRDRIYLGMTDAWKVTYTSPITKMEVRTEQINLEIRKEKEFSVEENMKLVANPKETKAIRNIAALKLSWLQRREQAITASCLDLGVASILNLPGEAFVEYQLAAQEMRPDLFVCVASYGDGGLGYIPTDKAFLEGGYEPTGAFAAPSEAIFTNTISKLLGPKIPQTIIPFKRFKKKNK
ncbi:MAG: hypothetical protein EBT92_03515 [Planctomycetes bacterium]|nr:hypothetical protein [Planctomycetota bacterium]NBY01035.1 hypothetical protein [Planctomycetota bacterium]